MITTTDQTGRIVSVPQNPRRIISLVPSQTELLSYLDLNDRVVGITKFCSRPDNWRKQKALVGGTKILKYGVIENLQPDLIIANKEENTQADILRLSENYPVWVSDVNTLDDALDMIVRVGELTQANFRAKDLAQKIRASFAQMSTSAPKSTLYLIWRKPYMAAGKQTFIDDMLGRCGFENVLTESRYPELKQSDIKRLNPDLVLFSSEPYPFKEHHLQFMHKLLPYAKLQLVDGEPFSWYGSRLLNSVPYFTKLLEVIKEN